MTCTLVLPPDAPRADWLAARRLGVGGSDVAAILGHSPYRTPLAVWLDKTGQDDDADSEAMEWGRRLERVVLDKFADTHPELTLIGPPGLVRDDEHPVFLATPDDLATGTTTSPEVVEAKTTGARAAWAWEDGATPDAYALQTLWYMGIVGAQVGHIACLIGGRTYVERVIERDDDLLDWMRTRVREWWDRYVVTGTPPPATPPTDDRLMARAYPAGERSEAVLDVDVLTEIEHARTLRGVMDTLETDLAGCVTRIKEALGATTDGLDLDGAPVVTWRPRKPSRRVDRTLLQHDGPDAYAACALEGEPTRVLRFIEPRSNDDQQ